jgi:ribonuclease VapC
MILDSSAIVAVLTNEPEADAITDALDRGQPGPYIIASPTFVETYTVIYHRQGEKGVEALSRFCRDIGIIIEAFHPHLAILACEAYARFHRGKHGLNFGDCFSYALAKARNDNLLCKGDDFRHTDIALVQY